MNRFPTARLEFAGRALTFGPIPRVVGTLSSPAWHVALADAKEPPDIVEVRLDLIGQPAG